MNNKYIFLLNVFITIQLSLIAQQQYIIDEVVGIIGAKSIKQSDIENGYIQFRVQGMNSLGDTKCEIYESMLKQKLLVNQAMIDSIVVSESQVETALNQRFNAEISKIGSVDKIEKQYNKSLTQIKNELREPMYEMLLVQKMQETIIDKIKVAPSEVKSFYNKIPRDSIPRIEAQIEFAQLALYPAYTEQSILEVKDKLLNLRKRIVSGENFAALAGFYSEDEGTAKRGGETGFLAKADLDPEYAKAASALNKPGDVSRIVETKLGYHIIQLIERRGDQINTRQIQMSPKPDPDAVKRVKVTLDSIANLIRKDSIKFDDAVKYYSMDMDTRFNRGMVINPMTGGTDFTREQLAPADYYAVKNLKIGEVSNPYESRDKNNKIFYKIITLKSQTEAHQANLKEDFSLIQDMAKNQKRMTIINDWFIEKLKTTYVQIDNSFKTCNFSLKEWFKAGM